MSACLLERELRNLGVYSMVDIPKKQLHAATQRVKHICNHIPDFPDIDLIINLSGQLYEGKVCYSNVIFLSSIYAEYNLDYVVRYAEPITFESKNLRFIRKILESVDKEHYLVMKAINNEYYAVGTIPADIAVRLFAFRVTFLGHMSWCATVKKQDIFKYENGSFQPVNLGVFNEESFKQSVNQAFNGKIADNDLKTLTRIAKIISRLGHGTSIVIFYSRNKYRTEIERLTHVDSGHGIKLEHEIDFSSMDDDAVKCVLKQITKIDGGIILDIHGKCGAMSCVFDGKLPKRYTMGTSSRGSRYNSLVLYINTMRAKAFGIVVSDDGSVDYISK